MANRNFAAEIAQIKSRGQRAATYLHHDLRSLQRRWAGAHDGRCDADDFYPIRAVTLLEVFSRTWIAQLIDYGVPYVGNAVELARNVKLDFDIVRAIHGRTITLGDVVAHSVPLNSFGQVCAQFKMLLGRDLTPLIKNAVSKEITLGDLMGAGTQPKGPVITDADEMCRSLSRLYEVRHILCHEAPSKAAYERQEIDGFLEAASQFATATHAALTQLLYGDVPMTMLEMKEAAAADLRRWETEVDELLLKLRGDADQQGNDLLTRAHQAWLDFRKAHCDAATDEARGGSLAGYLWLLEAIEVTKDRREQLKRCFPEEPQP